MDEGIFDCSICADKLDDAMETKCCHHCFCKRCIEDWLKLKRSCPSCRKALTAHDIVPNVPIQRMINSLPGECPNTQRGCTSKLTRGIVKDHLLNCEFVEILCANQCGDIVIKKDAATHQREFCSKRPTPCIQCTLVITLDAMPEHISTWCSKAQILCPNCKVALLREDLQRHHQKECLKITLTCPFAQFGCQFTGLRPEYHKHMIEDSDLHIGAVIEREASMSEEINKLKNELERIKGNQQSRNKFGFEEENPFKMNQQQPKPKFDFQFDSQPAFQFKAPEVPRQKTAVNNNAFNPPQQNNSNGFVFNAPPQPQPNSNAQPFVFTFDSPKNNASSFSFFKSSSYD